MQINAGDNSFKSNPIVSLVSSASNISDCFLEVHLDDRIADEYITCVDVELPLTCRDVTPRVLDWLVQVISDLILSRSYTIYTYLMTMSTIH